MTIPVIRISLAFLFCFTLLACATMSDVIKSKSDGSVQVYPVKADQAWDIAITVLRWEGCETIEEHRRDGYLLTTVGQNFVSAGCLVGVWVESMNDTNTKVTVVTKRRIQTNIATGLTETTFQRRFAQAVAIVNSGKPLPIDPPSSNQLQ